MKDDVPSTTSGYTKPLNFSVSNAFSTHVELSSGGYCRLFKAARHGKWYVLKGLQPQHTADPIYMAMLEKEFDMAVKMDHPNIVHTYGLETDPVAGPCIVMEYVDGRTLSDFLKEKPALALRRKVVRQLLDAMSYYHALQIVHRDLKPSNILVTRNGDNVKIIDFGLADADDYALLKEPGYTEGYAAPEQKTAGATVDCRTDLYALGVLLREIFPNRYRSIANRCTRTNPQSRYRDAAHVRRAIRRANLLAVLTPSAAAIAIVASILLGTRPTPQPTVPDTQQQTDTLAVAIPTDSIETEPEAHHPLPSAQTPSAPAHGLTVGQAVKMMQTHSDSLLHDYRQRVNKYPSWQAAADAMELYYKFEYRYMYHLLARMPQSKNDREMNRTFNALSIAARKNWDNYQSILDTLHLPNYSRHDTPPECLAIEKALEKELDAVLSDNLKLNRYYLEGHHDSIILKTKRYYSR